LRTTVRLDGVAHIINPLTIDSDHFRFQLQQGRTIFSFGLQSADLPLIDL
jgi:hypothetical protein